MRQRISTADGARGPRAYIVFNKPYGVLSHFTGEAGQRTLAEFDFPPGVYAAGRLDADSEGLLLLTDDGPLIHRLLDPKFAHPRTYWAQVERVPGPVEIEALCAGPILKDGRCRPCEARPLDPPPPVPTREPPIRFRKSVPTSWLEITLREGRNRQVRRMTAAVGHPTLRLIRVAVGDLWLGDLPPGRWRAVEGPEIVSWVGPMGSWRHA